MVHPVGLEPATFWSVGRKMPLGKILLSSSNHQKTT
jgi:hypothetical protein